MMLTELTPKELGMAYWAVKYALILQEDGHGPEISAEMLADLRSACAKLHDAIFPSEGKPCS
jgi:hypothetical protein